MSTVLLGHLKAQGIQHRRHITTGFLKLSFDGFLFSFGHSPLWSSSSVSVLIMVGLISVRSIGASCVVQRGVSIIEGGL